MRQVATAMIIAGKKVARVRKSHDATIVPSGFEAYAARRRRHGTRSPFEAESR
jgi:hypothetical protein